MLRRSVLAASPQVELLRVDCCAPRAAAGGPELAGRYALVLVRSGCFHRVRDGRADFLDATSAYFERPGEEQVVSHPLDGGDVCTVAVLAPEVVPEEAAECPGLLRTTPAADAAHRALLAACAEGSDGTELLDGTLRLADLLLRVRVRAVPKVERRLVDGARELLNAAPAIGLVDLARELAVSPRHLSRLFHAHTGTTLARYRNELRTRLALAAVADGAPSLARLAAELGFADQAHLSRTVRRLTGAPPSAFRSASPAG